MSEEMISLPINSLGGEKIGEFRLNARSFKGLEEVYSLQGKIELGILLDGSQGGSEDIQAIILVPVYNNEPEKTGE